MLRAVRTGRAEAEESSTLRASRDLHGDRCHTHSHSLQLWTRVPFSPQAFQICFSSGKQPLRHSPSPYSFSYISYLVRVTRKVSVVSFAPVQMLETLHVFSIYLSAICTPSFENCLFTGIYISFEFFIYCRYQSCQMYSGKDFLPVCGHFSFCWLPLAEQRLLYSMQPPICQLLWV